jgi:hypothetical protein
MNWQEVHVPRHAHRAYAKRGKLRDMDGGDRNEFHEFHEFHEFYGLCGFHLPREAPPWRVTTDAPPGDAHL